MLVVALVVGLQLPWSGTEVGAQQPDDHGNLLDNAATALTLGTGRAGNLETGGDVDVFMFTVAAGTTQDVWFYTVGTTDTLGRLFDDSGTDITTATPLAADDDGIIPGDRNFLVGRSLGEGTYYLAVSGADDTITGTYTVWSVKLDDTNAIFSRTLEPPMALAEPDFLHVLVPAIQEADKGRIYLSKWGLTGGEQDLWLYSDLSADTVGFLFDETGVVSDQLWTSWIAASDNGVLGGGSNFFIGAHVEAGTYYLAVSRSREDDGAFNVYYGNGLDQPGGIPEEPGDPEPPVITLDNVYDGVISPGGDADWFKFNVPAETDVVLRTTGAVDTIGALLDADGDEVDDNAYAEGETNFLLARTLEPGDYYIEVTPVMLGDLAQAPGPMSSTLRRWRTRAVPAAAPLRT